MATFPLGVHGRRVLAAAVLALVLVVVAWRHATAGSPVPLRVAPVAPARSSPAVTARLLIVDVVGAVRRPGIFTWSHVNEPSIDEVHHKLASVDVAVPMLRSYLVPAA